MTDIIDTRDVKKPVRTRTREQFRTELVEVSRRMFLQNGIHATSMADLGREMGVSKPTVYEAFENKQALIDAVFEAAAKDVDLSWIVNALKSPPPFLDFLEQTAESYRNFLRSPRSLEVFQLVIREGMHSNDMLQAFTNHVAAPSRAATRKLVALAMERGECAELPLDVVQRMLVAPLYFLMVDRAMYGDSSMPADAAISYIDHSFAALKTHLCGLTSAAAPGARVPRSNSDVVEAA